jgi:hypothetical protein
MGLLPNEDLQAIAATKQEEYEAEKHFMQLRAQRIELELKFKKNLSERHPRK